MLFPGLLALTAQPSSVKKKKELKQTPFFELMMDPYILIVTGGFSFIPKFQLPTTSGICFEFWEWKWFISKNWLQLFVSEKDFNNFIFLITSIFYFCRGCISDLCLLRCNRSWITPCHDEENGFFNRWNGTSFCSILGYFLYHYSDYWKILLENEKVNAIILLKDI